MRAFLCLIFITCTSFASQARCIYRGGYTELGSEQSKEVFAVMDDQWRMSEIHFFNSHPEQESKGDLRRLIVDVEPDPPLTHDLKIGPASISAERVFSDEPLRLLVFFSAHRCPSLTLVFVSGEQILLRGEWIQNSEFPRGSGEFVLVDPY